MAVQDASRNHMLTPMFREIYKNTWLKKISTTSSKRKKEKLWVVFCVHDDTDPYLETYVDNKAAAFHKPDWFVSLSNIQHISPTICASEQDYEFVITLETESVRLAAPSWDQMLDWVESLKAKLHELRVLSPKENVYSKLPERNNSSSLFTTRDPTSPLPPPPNHPVEILAGIETPSATRSESESSQSNPVDSERISRRNGDEGSNVLFNFSGLNNGLVANSVLPATVDGTTMHYEPLFQTENLPGPSTRITETSGRQITRFDVSNNGQLERSANNSPRILQPPPQPYKTLREQQVLQLEKEINHPGGVRLHLRKKDCISSIGFVDVFDSVWICGWKQKEHPMLYNALHIGDRLMSIENIPIKSTAEAHRILQSHYCTGLYVNIVIKRVPYGSVFVIHRETEGQSLGIVQDNNTAVIETVQSDSLAARHGLTAKTRTCDGTCFTNWVLTEINGRPLNLFFKKTQVRDRLNSVGKEISILVQPLDLIKQLKKQMKCLKNYKEYILQ